MDNRPRVDQRPHLAILATEFQQFVDRILNTLNRFLRNPIFYNGPTTAAVVGFEMREIRQNLRQTLILLKESFLTDCESLVKHATNEELYQAITRELSQQEIQKLKNFLHVCNGRFKNVMDSYSESCIATAMITKQLKRLNTKYSQVNQANQTRSRVAYSLVCGGIAVLAGAGAVVLAPVAVPAAIGIVSTVSSVSMGATGLAGATGMLSGVLLMQYNKKDVQAVEEAIICIKKYQSFNHDLHNDALTCAKKAKAAMQAVRTTSLIIVSSSQPPDTDATMVRLTFHVVDDESLSNLIITNVETISSALKEFKSNMETLKQQTSKAIAKIEEILAEPMLVASD